MRDDTGRIVRSDAGRDRDGIFCVVGMDQDGQRLLLADGKRRKVSRPKAKKPRHVMYLTDNQHSFDHPVVRSLQEGKPVSDRALRRALAAFKEGTTLGKR